MDVASIDAEKFFIGPVLRWVGTILNFGQFKERNIHRRRSDGGIVTRLGDLLDFEPLFKAFGNN